MKSFEKFIEDGEVKERTPNPEQAKSLMKKSEKRLSYALNREISDGNADLILEDCYEAVRETLDAFIIKEGYKSYSHEASIVYAFEELNITYNKANKLNKFRKLRNDSKYRGEDIKIKEAEDIRKIAKTTIPKLNSKFAEEVNK